MGQGLVQDSGSHPILFDRRFQVWRFAIGHSQLLLHSHGGAAGVEHINVLFEDVRAVKLRSSYEPLILAKAGHQLRAEILAFADLPESHRHRYLSLTLSTQPEAGFVLCARATVLAADGTGFEAPVPFWPDGARVIHTLRHQDQAS
jgi:hypothetical protein